MGKKDALCQLNTEDAGVLTAEIVVTVVYPGAESLFQPTGDILVFGLAEPAEIDSLSAAIAAAGFAASCFILLDRAWVMI